MPISEQSIGHFCQMGMLEHGGPMGQAHLQRVPGAPLYFSQVRDVVAYMRLPEQSHVILAIWVNDMGAPGATWDAPGATNWIAAQDAVYVVGGSAIGGMGASETAPFADPARAAAFAMEHGGTVMRLADIPESAILPPR